MARDWELMLAAWSKPQSDTENEKRTRTERAITDALNAVDEIRSLPIHVYAKGSYDNRTNVRLDSDVDINVEYTGIAYYDFTDGLQGTTGDEAGFQPVIRPYSPAQLKDDVERALAATFTPSAVQRGNKAITLREQNNRLAADIVPCFTYYRYYGRGPGGRLLEHKGTKLFPDRGTPVINWPRQHYDNGVAKNAATGKRFKSLVRILKRLENELVANTDAPAVPSYLIECLVYNVPNDAFGHSRLTDDLQAVLAHIWNNTRTGADCNDWVEVNGLKWLFYGSQPWTWQQAHAFADRAWNYVGFE